MPPPEAPSGEGWSKIMEQLPDTQLEAFMRKTEPANCRLLQRGARHAEVCELDGENMRLRIVFQDVDEQAGSVSEEPKSLPRSYRNEVASYKLDRLLDLNMVPVTIERSVDKRRGSAQLFLENAVDIREIEIYPQYDLRDSVEDQIVEARIFTALMGVEERSDAGKMLLPQEGRIAIADNTKGFGTGTELDPELMPAPCEPLAADFQHAMESLSKSSLDSSIGEYLSTAQSEALLERRYLILDSCSGG